jgi:succinyl-diaminopimelate desuccinylase
MLPTADLTRLDPLPLARALVACPSVTPADAGALDVLTAALEPLGFHCRRMPFGEVDNLFASRGGGAPHVLFAGHTDVVPTGDPARWSVDPFAGAVRDGRLIARGAADMKGAIAAFVAALEDHLARRASGPGRISLLITGDEEGPAIHGTRAVLAALEAEGERFDLCLIGEPTSVARLGDTIKVGRRGSLNALVTAEGVQGHVAYPERAANPVRALLDLLGRLQARVLDAGDPPFGASNLEITSIDVGNPAHNVIPATAAAKLNIRFNPKHSGAELRAWLDAEAQAASARSGVKLHVDAKVTGEPFRASDPAWPALVAEAITAELGIAPELSVSGGTSDGRFIAAACPVVEFGLVGATIHQVDEFTEVADLEALARAYARILDRVLAEPAA